LAEAFNKGGDINVFEDDNLLSESGVAGFSSGSGNGFSGAGNLHGNEEMYKEEVYDEETLEEEEELNEFEQAIEEMMARNEEEEYVDYQMGRKNDPNQLPNPPREINIPENASEDIDHEAYDLVEFLKSKLVERGIDVTPENISIVSLAYPGGTITDLEKISSILSQTNEELHGGQQRLDIEPEGGDGDIDAMDLASLRAMEESVKKLDKMITSLNEGAVKKKVVTKK